VLKPQVLVRADALTVETEQSQDPSAKRYFVFCCRATRTPDLRNVSANYVYRANIFLPQSVVKRPSHSRKCPISCDSHMWENTQKCFPGLPDWVDYHHNQRVGYMQTRKALIARKLRHEITIGIILYRIIPEMVPAGKRKYLTAMIFTL